MPPSPPDKPAVLLELARGIAAENPEFHAVLGPGAGDRNTQAFMLKLRAAALEMFGEDYSEKKICGKNSLAVDFYYPKERTIVEVALGLPNPNSEFEKDVLKAIMATESGSKVERLLFISRPGGVTKLAQPGRSAVIAWAKTKHALSIEVHDLHGEPRRRTRKSRARGSDAL